MIIWVGLRGDGSTPWLVGSLHLISGASAGTGKIALPLVLRVSLPPGGEPGLVHVITGSKKAEGEAM